MSRRSSGGIAGGSGHVICGTLSTACRTRYGPCPRTASGFRRTPHISTNAFHQSTGANAAILANRNSVVASCYLHNPSNIPRCQLRGNRMARFCLAFAGIILTTPGQARPFTAAYRPAGRGGSAPRKRGGADSARRLRHRTRREAVRAPGGAAGDDDPPWAWGPTTGVLP